MLQVPPSQVFLFLSTYAPMSIHVCASVPRKGLLGYFYMVPCLCVGVCAHLDEGVYMCLCLETGQNEKLNC